MSISAKERQGQASGPLPESPVTYVRKRQGGRPLKYPQGRAEIWVQMSPEEKACIMRYADDRETSMSAVMRRVTMKYLAEQGYKPRAK